MIKFLEALAEAAVAFKGWITAKLEALNKFLNPPVYKVHYIECRKYKCHHHSPESRATALICMDCSHNRDKTSRRTPSDRKDHFRMKGESLI